MRRARSSRVAAASVHWSLPDPAAGAHTPRAAYAGFDRLATELSTRVRFLLPVLAEAG